MGNNKHVILERNSPVSADRLLHTVDACPDRLALACGSFDVVEANQDERRLLRERHVVCETCRKLEIASSTDRVRDLVDSMARKRR